MKNQGYAALLCISFCVEFASPASLASRQGSQTVAYENHNSLDNKIFAVRKIRGTVSDKSGMPIADGTVGVFTDDPQHKFVASAGVTESGVFEFGRLTPGRYRVVVKYDSFCPANILVEVKGQAPADRIVRVHMIPRGLDSCSYGEPDKRKK